MQEATIDQALSDEECDRLDSFLLSIDPPSMNLESLDGYFAALVSGPDTVMPSEYLAEIWSDDYDFQSQSYASDIFGLLMRHWNAIATTLLGTLTKPDVYLPVLREDEDGVAMANDWAIGFLHGVSLRAASWQELMDDEEHGGLIIPVMMLAHDHDTDPETRSPPITPEKREEIVTMMIASLTNIYRYFEPQRRAITSTPRERASSTVRRTGPKVGRNDLCPCGSGRKYKHCCALTPPAVH